MAGRVLIVDDEAEVRTLWSRILESRGYEVASAGDGASALARFDAGPFDVVLTDLTMPGMNGLQLLRAIRERDLDVPVVIVTAAPSLESAMQAVEYGALRYVLKPLRAAELTAVVEKAVTLHRLARLKRQALALSGAGDHAGDLAGLEVAVDRALASLYVEYQPIVDWRRRRVFGYEALVRSHAEALARPPDLLAAAERLDRVRDIGRGVRAQAPIPFAEAEGEPILFLNLHPSDLGDDALLEDGPLQRMSDRVVLEVTERASLDGVRDLPARVAALRERGFRVAVDDLGAGYAGLTAFSLLEPEVCKLDMSLVRDIDRRPTQQKIVRSMAELCHDLGILLVAEGVETPAERDQVVELGCDLLQGYLFARPGAPFPEVAW